MCLLKNVHYILEGYCFYQNELVLRSTDAEIFEFKSREDKHARELVFNFRIAYPLCLCICAYIIKNNYKCILYNHLNHAKKPSDIH